MTRKRRDRKGKRMFRRKRRGGGEREGKEVDSVRKRR